MSGPPPPSIGGKGPLTPSAGGHADTGVKGVLSVAPGAELRSKSTFSHHLRIMREAGLVAKRIQGAKGYTQLRKEDVDRRFPGLLDSVIDADNPALV